MSKTTNNIKKNKLSNKNLDESIIKANTEKDLKIAKLEKKIKYLQSQIITDYDLNEIKEKEMEFFNIRDVLIQRISEYLFTRGFNFYIFGGYLRRTFEPFSNNIKQHKQRMISLNNSDIDCVVEYSVINSEHEFPNLQNIVKMLHNDKVINIIEVSRYKVFLKEHNKSVDTHLISFKIEYENNIIKFDMINQLIPICQQFKYDDYDVNGLIFRRNIYMDELQLKNNKNNGFFYFTQTDLFCDIDSKGKITPNIIKNIKNKIANPLFDDIYIKDIETFDKCIRLIIRQEKMIKENYTITKKIKTSNCIGSNCGVCMEKINNKNIPLQICNCKNAQENLCTNCIYNTIKNNKTKCPFCRNYMKMELIDENEINFPQIEICKDFLNNY